MKILILAATAMAAFSGAALADFPERPITWVVPFAAGGVTDITSRKLAERLQAELGQPVIVENKPGAGGLVGTKEVQIAAPDGYTVLFASSGPFGIQAALDPEKLKYDPLTDFEFIHGVTASPQLLVARHDAPFDSLQQLVDYAQDNPGELNFGSPGVGTAQHLGGELFKHAAGVDIEHIPYTSGSTQMVDLAAGVIDLSFDYQPIVAPYVEDGKMKILGTTGPERLKARPEIESVAEAGYPEAVNVGWTYLVVPKGVPENIRKKLEDGMEKVLTDSEIVEMIEADGRSVMQIKGHEAGKAFVASEIEKFRVAADGINLN
ncbi:hypothetical protein GCM10011402_37220 [Paracoccus acridae]|uniref:Tripartite tricarboxylate transporter substrate binding protein n=1 Tax=Paracoccus acridae TaxID=1795310 RepID=A0ABQ1VME8_9RHOB|nr:tripartite tricarboxylate transporter substrate binding protein [Paracoccus acridae]GGF81141.1 hypothetical protein GCM10011402_37220 [Paracoccus acridae]